MLKVMMVMMLCFGALSVVEDLIDGQESRVAARAELIKEAAE